MLKKMACIQMDIHFGQPEKNYENAEKWIHKASEEKCDLVILPELWTTGYDLTRLSEIADEEAKQTFKFLKRCSLTYQVDIIGGSIAKKTAQGHYNTMLIVDREGNFIKEYSKLHLFKLMDEHLFLQHGTNSGEFTLYGESFSGAICYDIRFPEWIRKPFLEGASALFVSAEWPKPRLSHWRNLLIARAIENQCYVIACNRVGNDPNNTFGGHSLIIDPWGEILAEGGEDEGLVIKEADFSLVKEVRRKIPVFSDRLPEYY
ncbi:carbon-nitrogen family hydrolase [Heyndrickxia acidicola]|uniref:Carbon-nitrogen family hydrolase n=1 Tax=Heyndrickxia acidicola TaxID=209389 RepID=A0ABU6MHZ5_9BACI|nr:carbon-nitrogen family hydrolase [Heyndrickxia acidicola]MED1204289.1 carbon-nitrogen family hydrolase [Heyndrickxia acidicola]